MNDEKFVVLTEEQIDFAIRRMSLWISTTESCPTAPDVDHSSLLRRVLRGIDPLPFPPPKRYSYPDYELGEGKPVKVGVPREVELMGGRVNIDQSIGWRWHDKEAGLLLHLASEEIYELSEGNILQKVQ